MNSKTFGTLVSLQETENIKTGRQERIDVNLSRIYPNDMDEFCFEEAIAGHRGWMAKDWSLNKGLKSAPISDAISGFQEPKLISCQVDGRRNASEPDLGAESISHDQRLSDVTQELSKDETISRPKRKKTMEVKGETQTGKFNFIISDHELIIV